MKKCLIFATRSQDKAREVRAMLPDWDILTLDDIGFLGDIIETGSTFEENAYIKAETVYAFAEGFPVLADDSGLIIDYLDGEPGVRSKRFLGEDTPYYAKNRKILDMMRGVPEEERTCRFVCTMVLLSPSGKNEIVNGVLEGEIATKIAGDGGFGYDPIFFVPENACTLAQMPLYEKNKISHRARALAQIKEILEDPAWLEQY